MIQKKDSKLAIDFFNDNEVSRISKMFLTPLANIEPKYNVKDEIVGGIITFNNEAVRILGLRGEKNVIFMCYGAENVPNVPVYPYTDLRVNMFKSEFREQIGDTAQLHKLLHSDTVEVSKFYYDVLVKENTGKNMFFSVNAEYDDIEFEPLEESKIDFAYGEPVFGRIRKNSPITVIGEKLIIHANKKAVADWKQSESELGRIRTESDAKEWIHSIFVIYKAEFCNNVNCNRNLKRIA